MNVQRELLKDADGKIRYWEPASGGREHYNLRVFIEGTAEELDHIKEVEYLLHSSFKSPRRNSRDRANGFPIEIWTWGVFEIQVTLKFTNNTQEQLNFYLQYSLPADDDSNYVKVE